MAQIFPQRCLLATLWSSYTIKQFPAHKLLFQTIYICFYSLFQIFVTYRMSYFLHKTYLYQIAGLILVFLLSKSMYIHENKNWFLFVPNYIPQALPNSTWDLRCAQWILIEWMMNHPTKLKIFPSFFYGIVISKTLVYRAEISNNLK